RLVSDWSSDVCSSDLVSGSNCIRLHRAVMPLWKRKKYWGVSPVSVCLRLLLTLLVSPNDCRTFLRNRVPSLMPGRLTHSDSLIRSEERRVGKECTQRG